MMNDIHRAKALFVLKRDIFKALTELYHDRVPQWTKADRTARLTKSGREVESVYRQKSDKREYYVIYPPICDANKWK